jgi:hypothetical protein
MDTNSYYSFDQDALGQIASSGSATTNNSIGPNAFSFDENALEYNTITGGPAIFSGMNSNGYRTVGPIAFRQALTAAQTETPVNSYTDAIGCYALSQDALERTAGTSSTTICFGMDWNGYNASEPVAFEPSAKDANAPVYDYRDSKGSYLLDQGAFPSSVTNPQALDNTNGLSVLQWTPTEASLSRVSSTADSLFEFDQSE